MLLRRLRFRTLPVLLVAVLAACGGGEGGGEVAGSGESRASAGVASDSAALQPMRCGDPGYTANAWGNTYHGRYGPIRLTYGRAQVRIKSGVLPTDGILALWFFPSMKERAIVYAGSERIGSPYTPPAGEQPFTLRIHYGPCRDGSGQDVEAAGIIRLEDGRMYTDVVDRGPGFIEVQMDSFTSTYAAAAPSRRVSEITWDNVTRDTLGNMLTTRDSVVPTTSP